MCSIFIHSLSHDTRCVLYLVILYGDIAFNGDEEKVELICYIVLVLFAIFISKGLETIYHAAESGTEGTIFNT